MQIECVISGGQTGADRAALDVALGLGLRVGGWVPRGRAAEDGAIAESYPNLRETESADPEARTELNVADADATLILSHGPLQGGSARTLAVAERRKKPILHIDVDSVGVTEAVTKITAWLATVNGTTLNVAGARASEDPRIYLTTRLVLANVLRDLRLPEASSSSS